MSKAILFAPIETFLIIEFKFDIDFEGLSHGFYTLRMYAAYQYTLISFFIADMVIGIWTMVSAARGYVV